MQTKTTEPSVLRQSPPPTMAAAETRCIDAREKLQRTCFRKGDAEYEGHMQQISQSYAALRSCEGVEKDKCKSDYEPRVAPKDY